MPHEYEPYNVMLTINRETGKAHYSYSKRLSRLLACNYAAHDPTHFCPCCLQPFSAKHVLERHRKSCRGVGGRATRLEMPKEVEHIFQFTNYSKQVRLPFVIYTGYKCTIAPIDTCQSKPERSSTEKTARVSGQGFGCRKKYYKNFFDLELVLDKQRPRLYGTGNDDSFLCGEPLLRPSFRDSVRDHRHFTSKYQGAAHSACNINHFRLKPDQVPVSVVFHKLKDYDRHLIMKGIAEVSGKLTCVSQTDEKYISFSLGDLHFIDSCQFMQASLDTLVASTPPEAFKATRQFEGNEKKLALVRRKAGIFMQRSLIKSSTIFSQSRNAFSLKGSPRISYPVENFLVLGS